MQSESPKQQNKAPPAAAPALDPTIGLRDYFAGQALVGELASLNTAESCLATVQAAERAGREIHEQIAFNSFRLADAMIKERG